MVMVGETRSRLNELTLTLLNAEKPEPPAVIMVLRPTVVVQLTTVADTRQTGTGTAQTVSDTGPGTAQKRPGKDTDKDSDKLPVSVSAQSHRRTPASDRLRSDMARHRQPPWLRRLKESETLPAGAIG